MTSPEETKKVSLNVNMFHRKYEVPWKFDKYDEK